MIASCKICKSGTCGIQVSGLERDSDQYLSEPQVSIGNYTFEQTITLNVVYSIDSKQNSKYEKHSIIPHTDIDIDEIEMDKDGLKQIDHYIIPTNEWIDYIIERDVTSLDAYTLVYYFNLQDENFYKYVNGRSIKVPVDEVLEINTENTTLIKTSVNTFIMCHLEKCFFKLCMYLLENLPCNDPCIHNKLQDFRLNILNRDIIWMAINAIKYALEQQQFFRAQSILEQVETCWGICKDFDSITSSNTSNCGCN